MRIGSFYSNNYIENESIGDRNKTLSFKEYLNEIKRNLKDIINNLKKFNAWKVQLIVAINFIFSKETNEEKVMYSDSDKWKS